MVVVCHVWPSLTPFNIYSLRLSEWLRFAAAADAWAEARRTERGGDDV